ncbi:unnamed protein product [Brachionus calyciflorus]|uniref:GYF domain-containing protein n=1 Tax=Brachionus calyciflorus TaxID=104777 RepID=A0A814FFK6_9BILA|nr:unnamed protein product [Brachionus calyciflorus]
MSSSDSGKLSSKIAKHRYNNEEMLSIFKTIEKEITKQPPPVELLELSEFSTKQIQKPVLLTPKTPEEKKCFSTCVNSQLAINAYKKAQGELSPKKDITENSAKNSKEQTPKKKNFDEDLSRGSNRRDKDLTKKSSPKFESNWRNSKEEGHKTDLDSKKSPKKDSKNLLENDKNLSKTPISKPCLRIDSLKDIKPIENNKKNSPNKKENISKSSKPEWFDDKVSTDDLKEASFDDGKFLTPKKDNKIKQEAKIDENNNLIDILNKQDTLKSELNLGDINLGILENSFCDPNWYFVDSQNKIQGPFNDEQMSGFFMAGYFNANLMLKRGSDQNFLPLNFYMNSTGRVPFMNDDQIKQYQKLMQMQQIQLQQIQNFNILQNQLYQLEKAGLDTSNTQLLLLMSKQLEQLQLKQKALIASGDAESIVLLNDLAIQHDALCSQMNTIIRNVKQSQTMETLEKNIQNVNPNVLSNQILYQLVNNLLVNQNGLVDRNMLNQIKNLPRDKLIVLFEQLKKEEEKRRKTKEIQMKFKLKEEARLLEEMRLRQEIEMRRLEETRLKEEYRKELHRKKLEELIKKQEEDKKNKKLDEQKIVDLFQKKQEELIRSQIFKSQSNLENMSQAYLEKHALDQMLLMEQHAQMQSLGRLEQDLISSPIANSLVSQLNNLDLN